jgi:hypothetical protein
MDASPKSPHAESSLSHIFYSPIPGDPTEVVDDNPPSPPRSFAEEVSVLRERSEQVLERIRALPESPKRIPFKSPSVNETSNVDQIETPRSASTSPRSPPPPEPIHLPSPTERYEAKYDLLSQEVQRLKKQNSRLNGQIRELQIKLRESKVEEDKLRNLLGCSQTRRSRTGSRPE